MSNKVKATIVKKFALIIALIFAFTGTVFAYYVPEENNQEANNNAIYALPAPAYRAVPVESAAMAEFSAAAAGMFSGGTGTLFDPFRIATKQDLTDMGLYSSGARLHGSVPTSFFNDASYVQIADINMDFYLGFRPIGFGQPNGFTGTFTGNGFTISNLVVDFDRQILPRTILPFEGVGLFALTNNATLRNINLENASVVVAGQTRSNIGVLVGHATHTVMDTVIVNGLTVNAPSGTNVGGLVGTSSSDNSISNVNARNVSVIGGNQTGGIIGNAVASTVLENVDISATVRGNENVGGLVGQGAAGTRILNNDLEINVTGQNNTGGVVGNIVSNVTLHHNHAKGTVSGADNTGGLFGRYGTTSSTHSHSNHFIGDITGGNNVGGLGGFSHNDNIAAHRRFTNNYHVGSVTGNNNVGGLFGELMGRQGPGGSHQTYITAGPNQTISDSYSLGEVHGVTNVGGAIGLINRHVNVSQVYVYSTITASSNIGSVGAFIGQIIGAITNNGTPVPGGVVLTNNIAFPHITASFGSTAAIVAGSRTGGATFTNNFYSAHTIIMGGAVGNFENATMVFDMELSIPGWWNNSLRLNENNGFDTTSVTRGTLPPVRQYGSTTLVPNQEDRNFFAGSQLPAAERLVHVLGSGEAGHMMFTATGNVFMGVDGLRPVNDFIAIGNLIRFTPQFLSTLPVGEHRFVASFTGGVRINIFIEVIEVIPEPPVFVATEVVAGRTLVIPPPVNIHMLYATFLFYGNETVVSIVDYPTGEENPFIDYGEYDSSKNQTPIVFGALDMGHPRGTFQFEVTFGNGSTQILTLTIN